MARGKPSRLGTDIPFDGPRGRSVTELAEIVEAEGVRRDTEGRKNRGVDAPPTGDGDESRGLLGLALTAAADGGAGVDPLTV